MSTPETRIHPGQSDPSLELLAGLFRRESLTTGPARTVANLFADLREVSRGEIIADYPERHLLGTRLNIERDEGHGCWEFYRLDRNLFMVAGNSIYERPRHEIVPGEGLIEFHLRLSGRLDLFLPGEPVPVTVTAPRLLLLYQPPGVALGARVTPKLRETGLSLYCRPEYLRELARLSGIASWPLLEEIEKHPPTSVWLRQQELPPSLQYIATSLLENSYRWGIRLLHAEAKALDLLCQVLAPVQSHTSLARMTPSQCESRQLDAARRLLSANLQAPPKIRAVARSVGMSESKLRRLFKLHLGMTVFEYAQGCRMRHALDLLRSRQLSVGQTAKAVGYRHQTSFASAFQDYFGFQPRKARSEMH